MESSLATPAPVPKVAVISVNYNSGTLIERCLSALSRQSLPPARIIVVDNRSTDGSVEGVEANHPDVCLIRLDHNAGFSAANNRALKTVGDCDWVALLNPDAFPEPDWLEKLMQAAEEFPDYSFFGSRMLRADEPRTLDGAGDTYHVSGLCWRRGCGLAAEGAYVKAEEIFSPCAAAALYRTDILEQVGGFDETFFCFCEDVDLGFRLRLAGYRCLYVAGAVVHHVGSAITGKESDFSVYYIQRNLVWTYLKNMPWPLFWLYLPYHVLMNLFLVALFATRGHAKIILKAKYDALKAIPLMYRQRRQIQSKKTISAWALRRVLTKWLIVSRIRRLFSANKA